MATDPRAQRQARAEEIVKQILDAKLEPADFDGSHGEERQSLAVKLIGELLSLGEDAVPALEAHLFSSGKFEENLSSEQLIEFWAMLAPSKIASDPEGYAKRLGSIQDPNQLTEYALKLSEIVSKMESQKPLPVLRDALDRTLSQLLDSNVSGMPLYQLIVATTPDRQTELKVRAAFQRATDRNQAFGGLVTFYRRWASMPGQRENALYGLKTLKEEIRSDPALSDQWEKYVKSYVDSLEQQKP